MSELKTFRVPKGSFLVVSKVKMDGKTYTSLMHPLQALQFKNLEGEDILALQGLGLSVNLPPSCQNGDKLVAQADYVLQQVKRTSVKGNEYITLELKEAE